MSQNPYKSPAQNIEPTAASVGEVDGAKPRSPMGAATAGALWSVLSAFPITALLALLFRFPVPFRGIDGGLAHVVPAILGLLFYGVFMGGFFVLAACGALAGVAARAVAPTERARQQLQRWLPIVAMFALLFVLATLDWYIGPW